MGTDLETNRCRIERPNNAGLRSKSGSTVETVNTKAHGVESNPGPANIIESGNDSFNTMDFSSALRALHYQSKIATRQWVGLINQASELVFVQVPKQTLHGLNDKRFMNYDEELVKQYDTVVVYLSKNCVSFKEVTREELSKYFPKKSMKKENQEEKTISLNNSNNSKQVLPPRRCTSHFYERPDSNAFDLVTAAPSTQSFNNNAFPLSNPTPPAPASKAVQPSDSHEQDAAHSMVAISNSDRDVPPVQVFQAHLSLPAQSDGQVSLESSARGYTPYANRETSEVTRGYTPYANRETSEVTHSYSGEARRRLHATVTYCLFSNNS